MLERTQNTRLLDVDVLEVGHHGSHNGILEEELEAVTPAIAVVSMGNLSLHKPFTAWAYGHPRKVAIDILAKAVLEKRNKAGTFKSQLVQRRLPMSASSRRYTRPGGMPLSVDQVMALASV